MELINPEYLIRPKERTLDGVHEYLDEARKDLKKAQGKKSATKDVCWSRFLPPCPVLVSLRSRDWVVVFFLNKKGVQCPRNSLNILVPFFCSGVPQEIAEKAHRVQILELKASKYERMKEEKKGKRKSMGQSNGGGESSPTMLGDDTRKDSTLMVMERINGTCPSSAPAPAPSCPHCMPPGCRLHAAAGNWGELTLDI